MIDIRDKKILIVVSTGRCGTVRLTEIFKDTFPDDFAVMHQTKISRFSNVVGNILYVFNLKSEFIKQKLFNRLIKQQKNIIITDPLVSMIIPEELVKSNNVAVIHIYRNTDDFAKSFYRFTRLKTKSFIAHNFIPFWQINILPLQNWILGEKIIKRYKKTAELKNEWFIKNYKDNKYFISIDMKDVFSSDIIEKKLNQFFNTNINIPKQAFFKKSNTSK